MSQASLRVRLTPRGGRNTIDRYESGVLHARVAAPPVGGAANEALVELLSDALGIRKGAIIIASGASSRDKYLEIADLSYEELSARIERAVTGGLR